MGRVLEAGVGSGHKQSLQRAPSKGRGCCRPRAIESWLKMTQQPKNPVYECYLLISTESVNRVTLTSPLGAPWTLGWSEAKAWSTVENLHRSITWKSPGSGLWRGVLKGWSMGPGWTRRVWWTERKGRSRVSLNSKWRQQEGGRGPGRKLQDITGNGFSTKLLNFPPLFGPRGHFKCPSPHQGTKEKISSNKKFTIRELEKRVGMPYMHAVSIPEEMSCHRQAQLAPTSQILSRKCLSPRSSFIS